MDIILELQGTFTNEQDVVKLKQRSLDIEFQMEFRKYFTRTESFYKNQ